MSVNLQRRKSVMARSMRLGHCVCDPKQPCPCNTFRQFNVCQCAGERLPRKSGMEHLTWHVHKAGCASKIGQADLLRILDKLPPVADPNVLVGTTAGDDAGVYRLDNGCALVQTVDVFTPCVDDPYTFGQVAAANSLSDVYAMGGRPITALSIVGFPIDERDASVLEAILRGGIDKMNEAGCAVIGGHSINDAEVKCGFAVTGLIAPDRALVRDNAQPGDALVLTKPLGTGMLAFAAQLRRLHPAALESAAAAMTTLNRDAAELMLEFGAHACTDVTGFGLAGHLVAMARGSRVRIEIDMTRLPVFAAVAACISEGLYGGAVERNQEYAMAWVRVEDDADEACLPLLCDAQTSGGLLVVLPEDAAADYVAAMRARGHDAVAVIGNVKALDPNDDGGLVAIVKTGLGNFIGDKENMLMDPTEPRRLTGEEPTIAISPGEATSADCCADPPGATIPQEPGNALDLFTAFMKEANRPARIDARAKRLMAIALSVAQRCEPCLRIHIKHALAMGISWEEIGEAAQLAVAFAGCSALMFYNEVRAEFGQA